MLVTTKIDQVLFFANEFTGTVLLVPWLFSIWNLTLKRVNFHAAPTRPLFCPSDKHFLTH